MIEYLDRVAPSWYPRRHVQFIVQKEYDGFDDMLKNRMLYAGINVMAPVMTMHVGIDNKKGYSIVFVYDEKTGRRHQGFLIFLGNREFLLIRETFRPNIFICLGIRLIPQASIYATARL
jgi:hypothetical protein